MAVSCGLLLSLLPVIGCSSGVLSSATDGVKSSSVRIPHNRALSESTLDILTFEDDRYRRLDSYQRLEEVGPDTVWPASTGGDKIFFLCMNSQRDRYEWADINSYSSLRKVICDLELESLQAPVMTGECRGEAGGDIQDADMSPLVSEIYLESIRCDFSGTPYQDRKITEVKAYLTNVNASCGLIQDSSGENIRIINAGMLNPHEVKMFRNTEIIVQDIASSLGTGAASARKGFLCYPLKEDPSRNTRLVIEGKIDGETYFWPVEVCPEGISRNHKYICRMVIRRKGSTDPDCTLKAAEIDFELKVKPWKEKEEYKVRF